MIVETGSWKIAHAMNVETSEWKWNQTKNAVPKYISSKQPGFVKARFIESTVFVYTISIQTQWKKTHSTLFTPISQNIRQTWSLRVAQ